MLDKGHIGRAIQVVATNPFEFLLAGVLMGVLTVASLGLLIGPASGGIVAMALKRCRNEEIDIGDAFGGFENFTSTFLVGLGWVGLVAFGTLFLLVPGLILAALFAFALPAAVDRPITPGEAFKHARRLAAADLLASVILFASIAAVGISGIPFLIVGSCATMPVALTALTLAYHEAAYPSRAPQEAVPD